MIDPTLMESYIRDANPIPDVQHLDPDELAYFVAALEAEHRALESAEDDRPARGAVDLDAALDAQCGTCAGANLYACIDHQRRAHRDDDMPRAKRIDRFSRVLFPGVYLALLVLVAVTSGR